MGWYVKPYVLPYRLERFDIDGVARFIICHRGASTIPVSASVYEAHLNRKAKSRKGTPGTSLQHILYLYAWAECFEFDLENALFTGEGIQLPEIASLVNWLGDRYHCGVKLSGSYVSQVLGSCRKLVLWFVRRSTKKVDGESLNITLDRIVRAHKGAWAEHVIDCEKDLMAPDIDGNEYSTIENFLHDKYVDFERLSSEHFRNYLMWRVAWEFGLRIGEILALRVKDVDLTGGFPSLSIVRIDERIDDTFDPRSPYAPQVKTLSRELGFIDKDSSLPQLLEMYLSKHRVRKLAVRDGEIDSPFLDHDFFFISHNGSGDPLSTSGAQKVAIRISCSTGIKFNWHLIRHAFFNRKYKEISGRPNNQNLIDNLVYWGGWASDQSLRSYVRRAIKELARAGLSFSNNKYVQEYI